MPSNAYLRRLYSVYAPIYDLVIERLFAPARREALRSLALTPGQRVLVVGAGTGQDLDHLPADVVVTMLDLTPAMLDRARQRARRLGRTVTFVEGRAEALPFDAAAFDAVVLHFVVAVVPDPKATMLEAARVLRPGGRMSILDKFAPDDGPVSGARRALNLVTPWLATDVARRLGPMLLAAGLTQHSRENAGPLGLFRAIIVSKPPLETR